MHIPQIISNLIIGKTYFHSSQDGLGVAFTKSLSSTKVTIAFELPAKMSKKDHFEIQKKVDSSLSNVTVEL